MSESVIADDLYIKGEVTTSGDIELKGTIEGDITCRTLMIAEAAKIKGSAKAEKVVVRGTVEGRIHGVRVTLTSSAKVQGELICKALAVDEEAYFDGTSQRVEDPLSTGLDKKPETKARDTKAPEAKVQDTKAESSNGQSDSDKSVKDEGDKVRPMITSQTS